MSSNPRSSKSRKVPTREQLDEEYNTMTNSCSQELTDILSDVFLESYLGDRHKQVSSLWTLKGKTNLPVYNPRQVLPSLHQFVSHISALFHAGPILGLVAGNKIDCRLRQCSGVTPCGFLHARPYFHRRPSEFSTESLGLVSSLFFFACFGEFQHGVFVVCTGG